MQEEGAGTPILTRFIWKKKLFVPLGLHPPCPLFPFSARKIDGTRTPRDERRRAQHNEGKSRPRRIGGATCGACWEREMVIWT